jgi:hypothetical protein
VPSMPQIPRQPPVECLSKCPQLPRLQDGKDLTVRLWEYELIDMYGECRRKQVVCAEWFKE